MRRSAVLAATVVLLIPAAMALRAEAEGASPRVRPQPTSLATIAVPVSASVATEAPTVASVLAAVDLNALPEAIPDPTEPATTKAKAKVVKVTATTAKPKAKTAAAVCTPYTIRAGDAWSLIATRTQVSLRALLAANHASASTSIFPGGTLCLPAGAVVPTTTVKAAKVTTTTVKASTHTTTPKAPGTTTPKVPVLTPPPNVYTRDQVIQIIRDIWPDDLEDQAIAIADRESHLVPTARNFCCYGLFQIYYSVHASWLATVGVTNASQLWDPQVNARVAYLMYQRNGGFGPWM